MKFSIITVVYNAVDTIERTIQSVISQTYKDYEYIIIDGGSSDGTVEILKKYDDVISFWISEPDDGIYDAMNKGIIVSKGNWIMFINADDWLENNALELFNNAMIDHNSMIYYGKVNRIELNGKRNGYIGINQRVDVERLHMGNLYCHQGLLINRQMFQLIGMYDLNYKVLADFKWNLDAHCKGYNPHFLDEVVSNFSVGGVSTKVAYKEKYQLVSEYYKQHKQFEDLEVQRKRGLAEFELMLMDDINNFEGFFEYDKSYYIWGYGKFGKKCIKIFNSLEINLLGIIDSIQLNDETILEPKDVFFEPIGQDTIVFITTIDYQDTILEQLKNVWKVPLHKIITMQNLFVWCCQKYKG